MATKKKAPAKKKAAAKGKAASYKFKPLKIPAGVKEGAYVDFDVSEAETRKAYPDTADQIIFGLLEKFKVSSFKDANMELDLEEDGVGKLDCATSTLTFMDGAKAIIKSVKINKTAVAEDDGEEGEDAGEDEDGEPETEYSL